MASQWERRNREMSVSLDVLRKSDECGPDSGFGSGYEAKLNKRKNELYMSCLCD